jgi:hypothetical protein
MILSLFGVVNAAITVYCKDQTICVYSESGGELTIFSSVTGWASFGYSPDGKMAGSRTYTAWMNSKGEPMLQRGVGAGHRQPTYDASVSFNVKPTTIDRPEWAKIAVTFVPIAGDAAPNTRYIWAVSNAPPSNVDSISSSYMMHQKFESFDTFLAVQSVTGQGGGQKDDTGANGGQKDDTVTVAPPLGNAQLEKRQALELGHGITMICAWFIGPLVAIHFARNMKSIGHLWYQIHLGTIIVLTFVGSILGLGLIYWDRGIEIPSTVHGALAWTILSVMMMQILLGFYINYIYQPGRLTWYDMLHRIVGRLLAVMGIVNICLGLEFLHAKYGGWYLIVMIAFAVLGPAAYLLLLSKKNAKSTKSLTKRNAKSTTFVESPNDNTAMESDR